MFKDGSITDWCQTLIALAALGVSIAAIYITVQTENRNLERYQVENIKAEELNKKNIEIALGQIKPYLVIHSINRANQQAIVLQNHGAGPAIVKEFKAYRDGKWNQNVAKLFSFFKMTPWADWRTIPKGGTAIPSGGEIMLAELKNTNYFDLFLTEKKQIYIEISYTDVVGSAMINEYYHESNKPSTPEVGK